MAYDCSHCEKKLQNPQALKMHIKWKHGSEATKGNALESEEATKPLKDDISSEGSDTPISEPSPSNDLEIEEADYENPVESLGEANNCPECNFELKDYENPCPSCGALIEWGE